MFRIDFVKKVVPTCTVLFTVSDTGIGVSGENQKKLFKNFSQVDSSITRKYGGSGLGLCISQKLAESMGGSITCNSEGDGKGSSFQLLLPLDYDLF